MAKKIITVFFAVLVLSVPVVSCSTKSGDIINNPRVYFSTEDEYIKYMKEKVVFPGITLTFIEIRKGDNFWKIARDSGINIDTLIGINFFWDDLMAREGQIVIVPSEQGVIEFIGDKTEIKNLAESYNVSTEDIVVQDKTIIEYISELFSDEKCPLAVFIRDARPRSENMSLELADKFKVREMFRSPLGGRYSSFFGNRKHPVYHNTRFHNGVDIAAPYGTYIGASRNGLVVSTGWMGAYGKSVIIEHDSGYRTLYGHMSVITVRPGQYVKAGKVIGRVGSTGLSTGPHLHFTLWHNGKLLNPMDVLW